MADENLRLALEEANRWYRHIENFTWALTALLLLGTGSAIIKAEVMKGENPKVIFLGVIMIIIWYLYAMFLKHIWLQSQYFLKKINQLERGLGIDVLPQKEKSSGNNNQNEENKKLLEQYYSTFTIKHSGQFSPKTFPDFIIIITYLVWVIWLFFILEFLCKEYQCNCLCNIFC